MSGKRNLQPVFICNLHRYTNIEIVWQNLLTTATDVCKQTYSQFVKLVLILKVNTCGNFGKKGRRLIFLLQHILDFPVQASKSTIQMKLQQKSLLQSKTSIIAI